MRLHRGINVWIWAASLVLYWWIKGGGAEAELAAAKVQAAEVWHTVIAHEHCEDGAG